MASKAIEKKTAQRDEEEEFEWTQERERCLDLILRGFSKLKIAEELGVHRNTINNWCKHPTFVRRMSDELNEFTTTTRLRRVRTTSIVTDTVSNMTVKALKNAEKKPLSLKAQHLAKGWLGEFRSMRNEERLNFGESTDNRNVNTQMHHSGQIATGSRSFKEYLQEQVDRGVVDAQIVSEAGNPQEALVKAVEHVLVEGDYLEEVDKAGREKEEANKSAK